MRENFLQMAKRELVLVLFNTVVSEVAGASLWSKISCKILYEVPLMYIAL